MRLLDCFLECVTFASILARSPDSAGWEYAAVRKDMDRILARMDDCARRFLFSEKDFDDARFAVLAWVDEAVLCSSWEGRRQWVKKPLQRVYYGTANAGEEFFVRLEALLGEQEHSGILPELAASVSEEGGEPPDRPEVLEVYAVCLALGFAGRYFSKEGREALEGIRTASIERLAGEDADIRQASWAAMFPEAYSHTLGRRRRFGWRIFDPLAILFLVLPAVICGVLFSAYKSYLEDFFKAWAG